MSTTSTQEFSQWLKANTPADVYMDLAELSGINKPRLTRLLKRPATATATEVRQLAKALNDRPMRLMADHGLGFETITLREVDALWAEATQEEREAYVKATFQPLVLDHRPA